MSQAQELMYHMLRVDFVVVDWYCGVCGGCFVCFVFLLGAGLAQRGEREREKKHQSFCNEEGFTHLTYS